MRKERIPYPGDGTVRVPTSRDTAAARASTALAPVATTSLLLLACQVSQRSRIRRRCTT